jgi:uncharacterized tellurite resistance protein B-like protein
MWNFLLGGALYFLGLWLFLTSTSLFATVMSVILSIHGLSILIHAFEKIRGERIYETLRKNEKIRTRYRRESQSELQNYIYNLRILFENRNSIDVLSAILAGLCIHIAKADGKISENEIKTIRASIDENFRDKIDHKFISEIVTLTKQHIQTVGLNKLFQSAEKVMFLYLEIIQYLPSRNQEELITLLFTIIYEVAISDTGYASHEKEVLFDALCTRFGITSDYQEVIKRTAVYKYNLHKNSGVNDKSRQDNQIQEAKKLFGLEDNFTKDDLEKAWKKMAMAYHPDKFHNKGEEVYNMMNQKFLQAKQAYDLLNDYIKDMR